MNKADYQAEPFTRQEVQAAFDNHGLCACENAGHVLAMAAHNVLEAEVGAKNVDRVWNSNKPTNLRACQSALWRATWYARDMGLITVSVVS